MTSKSSTPSPSIPGGSTDESTGVVGGVSYSQELKDLTVKELRAVAKSRGMVGYSDMNKSELLEVLG